MLSSHLVIGEIVKPQGIKGEVKVKPITAMVERFWDLDEVYFLVDKRYVLKKVQVTRVDADAAYLLFDGVSDRNEAEKLRGQLLYVDRAHALRLDEDTEFICDLIGCVAEDDTGRVIGELVDVMQPGGNDVYAFKGPLGDVLVPALKSVVLSVDIKARRMLLCAARMEEVAVYGDD